MKSIDLAEEIRTSIKCEKHNERIVSAMNNTNKENEKFYLLVFSELTHNLFNEYTNLRKAYDSKDTSEITWRGRNLLEISIWITFCTVNRENAEQFLGDAARDVNDLLDQLVKWDKSQEGRFDWKSKIEPPRAAFYKFNTDHGLGNIEEKFTRVQNAAQIIGQENEYNITNKMFSKFLHPTALKIMGNIKKDSKDNLNKAFYDMGCCYFILGFSNIEEHMKKYTPPK